MRELFEEQLLLLNQELTEMGSLCEEIISLATQALGSYTKELGEKVSKVGAKIDLADVQYRGMNGTKADRVSGILAKVERALVAA